MMKMMKMMKFIKNILLGILVTGIVSTAAAQRNDAIIGEINRAAAAIQSMECDFVQTKHISLMNDKMVSAGHMVYKQSDRLRWEYLTPYSYIFLLNGNSVTLKSGDKTDVIDIRTNRLFSEIARIMMSSVTGKCLTDSTEFKVSLSESSTEYTAKLTPLKKEMKQMFSTIVLHFDRTAEVVCTIELHEKSGDRTVIELKNIKKNLIINEDLFTVN